MLEYAAAHPIEEHPAAGERFLSAPQVRGRYGGMSDASLARWLNDPDLEFPQPTRFKGRRYWRMSQLIAWEERQDTQQPTHDARNTP